MNETQHTVDDSQFRIPDGILPVEANLPAKEPSADTDFQTAAVTAVRARIEALLPSKNPASPEKTPYATYGILKKLENVIFESRETARAIDQSPVSHRAGWLQWLGLAQEPQVTTADLVEAEKSLSANLFPQGGHFWLDTQTESGALYQLADWYEVAPNPADAKNPIVIRFQTTPHSIHKLYKGREVPMTLQDLEHFVGMVSRYAQSMGDLYPVDATLAELQQELVDELQASSSTLGARSQSAADNYELAA